MAGITPTLAEVGHVLWGANWAEPLAVTMRLTKEEVVALDAHPEKIPPGTAEQLIILCRVRIQEIGAILECLKSTESSMAIGR
jgi:hypothetical protein